MSYREAMREAIRDAMRRDPRVFLMGEDVGRYGGGFAVSLGLVEEFGEERVRDTPLSESAFVGAGIGAALGGLLPIVEVMTVNFALLAMDQVVNTAAALRHMSGGQYHVPLVIRTTTGAGRQLAAQHSHSLECWFAHVPGLRVLAPATVTDARAMLWPALMCPDPVVIVEHGSLYPVREPLTAVETDIEAAVVRREGADVSVIANGGCVRLAAQAADELEEEGISAEVLDLRVLRPLDEESIARTALRTGRVVVVDEGWRSGGLAAEVVARVTERCFARLRAPVARVCSAEVPIPYARGLEEAALPSVGRVVAACREVVRWHG